MSSTYQVFCLGVCPIASFFVVATTTCDPCSWNCQQCVNATYCTSCFNNSNGILSGVQCVSCNTIVVHCGTCSNTSCTQCEPKYYLDGQTCLCRMGDYIGGDCITIFGCIQILYDATGHQLCQACDSATFKTQPINNSCACLVGHLLGELCVDVDYCVAAANSSGTIECLYCDSSLKRGPMPDASGQCTCQDHYVESPSGVCLEVCGDGMLFNTSNQACDDGNTAAGDGCSPSCSVETDYRCENGSSSSPSACYYTGPPLTFALASIRRT
jgi:cysteine-rich repeat protein